MTKTKRNKGEGKTAYAARVINTHDVFMSAKDAWERLVDKRGVGVKGWEHFQSNLSDAVRLGLLSKIRGHDNEGRSRVLYGPLMMTPYESENFKGELATEVVDAVQRPNRPTINDIPLGDLLSYNHVERDDITSVLVDLIYDTPLGELRQRYPTLEDLVWSIVGGDE